MVSSVLVSRDVSDQPPEKLSRLLSYALRHRPDALRLELDAAGWVAVDDLLAALASYGTPVDRAELSALVRGSDKQRFAFSADGSRIRASQGLT